MWLELVLLFVSIAASPIKETAAVIGANFSTYSKGVIGVKNDAIKIQLCTPKNRGSLLPVNGRSNPVIKYAPATEW